MALGDMFDKAKEELSGHKDAVDGAIDKADELLKEHTPDQIDGSVDQAAQKAKDALG